IAKPSPPPRGTIVTSQRPPTRASMRTLSRGTSMWAGPYHAATSSGSVHALKTCSRGASKMRVIRTSWSVLTSSVIGFSFAAQVRVEAVHLLLPGALARLHPCNRLVERLGVQPAGAPLRLAATHDQPGALEHLQVARDRGQAHRERLGELVDRRLALGQARQDRAPRRVGERTEGQAQRIGRHLTMRLINDLAKCTPQAGHAADIAALPRRPTLTVARSVSPLGGV